MGENILSELDDFIMELKLRTELKRRGIDVKLEKLNLTNKQKIATLNLILNNAKKEGF